MLPCVALFLAAGEHLETASLRADDAGGDDPHRFCSLALVQCTYLLHNLNFCLILLFSLFCTKACGFWWEIAP